MAARVYGSSSVDIAASGSLSGGINLGGARLVALVLPTIASAAITFQGSVDGVNYYNVYNSDGTTETATGASTGNRIVACPAAAQYLPWVKVRSGTAGSAVTQSACTIKLITEVAT